MDVMKNLISMCKKRGFIFSGSDIYGGLANTWDYGPLGVELKNNVKNQWWKYFVQSRSDMLGLDSSILIHPKVWEASGHINSFSDPLIDCKNCKERFRIDNLIPKNIKIDLSKDLNQLKKLIESKEIKCPKCEKSNFTDAREFNLMFKTFQGVLESKSTLLYLRPETAQGIFINFNQIQKSSRKKIPFGVGQIGKSFRNEITPGNFIFRTREFEQMEIEYFIQPNTELKYFDEWINFSRQWFLNLGINVSKLRFKEHSKNDLSHYSNKTVDIEYKFPFDWGELAGIASRTDFDLNQHSYYSKNDLKYHDPYTGKKYIPYVIEPSFGLDRSILTFLVDAYREENLDNVNRFVLKIDKKLAPIKIAILPLKKNETNIVNKAHQIFDLLKNNYNIVYDDSASIGKLYRRQDEIGTPFCITVDFESIEVDNKVTIRDRDSMNQQRIAITQLRTYFSDNL